MNKPKHSKTPTKNIKYIVYLLVFIVAGAIIGLGANFVYNAFTNKEISSVENSQSSSATGKNIGGINYSSDLPESGLNSISVFLKSAYQADYLPKDLEIKLVTKAEQTGDQYVGTWTAQEKAFLVLFVAGKDNTTPRYMRTWALDTGTDVNQKLAETSLTAFFDKQFIQTAGSLACSEIKNPESTENELIKDCSSVQTNRSGDKVGISVRAPVLTSTGEKGTSTAACFIPKEFSTGYTFKTCI